MGPAYDIVPGARNAVQCCLAIGNGDPVVVITDKRKAHIGDAIANEARQVGAVVTVVRLESYGQRPFHALPPSLAAAVRQAAPRVSLFVATGEPGEIPFRVALVRQLLEQGVRHGHMIDIDDQLMAEGMLADYRVVSQVVHRVTDRVRRAHAIHVTNSKGTAFTALINPALKWQPCPGTYWEPGTWGNLPEGETYTCPGRVDGVVVADVLGDHLSEKYGVLRDPVSFEIEGSVVKQVRCNNPEVQREVEAYLATDPNGRRVGEFAIGANLWVQRLVGNLLQDEKLPGIHVAFGDPIGSMTGADWTATTHLDVVPEASSIWVDGELLMSAGRFERWVVDGLDGVPGWA